jgi:O-antigen/teichoic acid export membrane protein
LDKSISKKFYTDSLWYLIGSALPAIALLLRSPIYTRIYSTESYGLYSIAYISFSYVTSISYQWITNNAWRYYLKYKKTGQIKTFWTVALLMYFVSALIVTVGSSVLYFIVDDPKLRLLIIYGCFYFFTSELLNTLLVPIRVEGKAGYYNLLNTGRHTISFILLLGLTFIWNMQIEAFFLAPLIVNSIIIIYVILNPGFSIGLNLRIPLKKHIHRFLNYGFGNLIFNIGLFFLISSDRYIIALFEDFSKVGIYNQTYNIAQITITAVFSVLQSALNPILIQRLEHKPQESNEILTKGFYFAIYLLLPITVIASIFSKQVNIVLLGEKFREAWKIMPFIFAGAFVSGLNYFAVIKLKFLNKLKQLMIAAMAGAFLNIGLNFLLIPVYGYKVAALTTLVSYTVLILLLFKYAKIGIIQYKPLLKNISALILMLMSCISFNLLFNHILTFKETILSAIVKSIIFVLVYYLTTKNIAPFKKNYFE